MKGTIRYELIFTAVLALAVQAQPVFGSQMFLEYRGSLNEGYTFYRGAFDLADLDHDGSDEMVIADDSGGYQVYHYTQSGFVPMWISDPIVDSGFIVEIDIIHENIQGFMPQILMLDSTGTLHRVRFTGYFFEEIAEYEDYSREGESGRLVVTDLGGGERSVIIALNQNTSDEAGTDKPEADDTGEVPTGQELQDTKFYKLTESGLVEITSDEFGAIDQGKIYFIQDFHSNDPDQDGFDPMGMLMSTDPSSGRAGFADLDKDELNELLLAITDPVRPIERLEIYNEEDDVYSVNVTIELPLINEMVLGDVDGDGFTEIVSLTYDGEVIIYQWDPLSVKLEDGTDLSWEAPHREIDGVVWMSAGMFEDLGCAVEFLPKWVVVTYGDNVISIDREDRTGYVNEVPAIEDIPSELIDSIVYFPLLQSLEALGIDYTSEPENNLIEINKGE
jgi:hypothetical protein